MAELMANSLSEEEKKEIKDKYTNPWTEEVIAEYTRTTEECLVDLYCHIQGKCADPDNPTYAEKEAARAAVQEDVKTVMEPFTTTDQDMLDEMANMIFKDEYMLEIDAEILSYASTDEERQWASEYQSALLNLQSSVDGYCDYLSAALLLDKNLTDYADGLEIAEEAGITVAPAIAEQVRVGTLESVVVDKVEQAEGSDIYYAYDSSGTLIYTIDISKQLDKVLAHKNFVNNGDVNAVLRSGKESPVFGTSFAFFGLSGCGGWSGLVGRYGFFGSSFSSGSFSFSTSTRVMRSTVVLVSIRWKSVSAS